MVRASDFQSGGAGSSPASRFSTNKELMDNKDILKQLEEIEKKINFLQLLIYKDTPAILPDDIFKVDFSKVTTGRSNQNSGIVITNNTEPWFKTCWEKYDRSVALPTGKDIVFLYHDNTAEYRAAQTKLCIGCIYNNEDRNRQYAFMRGGNGIDLNLDCVTHYFILPDMPEEKK